MLIKRQIRMLCPYWMFCIDFTLYFSCLKLIIRIIPNVHSMVNRLEILPLENYFKLSIKILIIEELIAVDFVLKFKQFLVNLLKSTYLTFLPPPRTL